MALSGSFNTSSVTAYGITTSFTVNWTATQDISSNTSTIAWTVTTVQSPTGSGYKRGIFYIKVTINGHEVVLKNLSINNTSDVQVYNGLRLSQAESTAFSSSDKQYLTIRHDNSSGDATLNLSLAVGVGTNPANVSGSTSTALNTIPRATTDWTLTTHPGVIDSTASKIYTNGYFSGTINSRASNNFRHSLTLTIGSTTAEIWSEGKGTGNLEASFPSSAYRLPDTLKRALKNYYYNHDATSCSCTLNLDTYSNNTFSTKIGTNSKSVTINLIQPSASNFTFDSDSINGISDLTSSTLSYSGLDAYAMYDSITITRSGNSTASNNWTVQTGTSARAYPNIYTDTYTTSFSGSSGSFSLANSAFEEAMIDRIRCIVTASIVIKYGKSDSAKISFSKTYKLYISTNHKIVITGTSITYSNKKNNYLLAGISGISYKFTLNRNNTHASIASYNFTNIGTAAGLNNAASINNSTVTATYSILPTSTTNYTVGYKLSVTDSRGWVSDTYDPGTTAVIGYVSPSITSASVKRTASTSSTVEDPKGTYAYFSITWSKGTHGTSTTASTANGSTMSITGTSISGITNTSYTGYASSFPDTNSYNFTVTVTDSTYGISATKTLSISKFIIPLSLHPDGGVGLGTLAVQGYITNGLPLTLDTPVNITHQGDVKGTTSFDGHTNITENLWIPYCKAVRNNHDATNDTYVYHRVATIGPINTNWYDASAILLLDQGYYGGGWGIARIILRTNSVTDHRAPDCEVQWLARTAGLPVNSLQYGLYNNSGIATLNIYYYATGRYSSVVIRKLESYRDSVSSGRWTLINSNASGSTRTEVYTSMSTLPGTSTSYTSTDSAAEVGISGRLGSSTVGSSYQPIYLASGAPTTTNAFLRVDTSTPLSSSTGYNTINGEVKFINSGYASTGTLIDTASGIACSNKGSRYLVNELLTDGIVAPASNYTNNNFNTTGGTIAFYKYTSGSGGTYTGLTKTAEIDANGTYKPKVSRDFTFSLTAIAGYSQSTTVLRFKLFIPTGYTSVALKSYTAPTTLGAGGTSVSGSGTIALMSGTNDQNLDRGYVNVQLTTSSAVLTRDRAYVMKSGTVVLTLS